MNKHYLEPRILPSQSRASKTVELILETAAGLLEELGFEELTTNKICKAAGLTPPALYRYFPNKYAIVSELAQRLMKLQNEALELAAPAFSEHGVTADLAEKLLAEQLQITREFKGGVAILKTLYATPQLSEIRLASHTDATAALTKLMSDFGTEMEEEALFLRVRLIVEVGNSAIEMLVENPQMDEATVIRDTAEIMYFHLTK